MSCTCGKTSCVDAYHGPTPRSPFSQSKLILSPESRSQFSHQYLRGYQQRLLLSSIAKSLRDIHLLVKLIGWFFYRRVRLFRWGSVGGVSSVTSPSVVVVTTSGVVGSGAGVGRQAAGVLAAPINASHNTSTAF